MSNNDKFIYKCWCSEIDSMFAVPAGVKMPTNAQTKKLEKLLNSEHKKTKEEKQFIKDYEKQVQTYKNPPVSKTAINSLLRQYSWYMYNKKIASNLYSEPRFAQKGTMMEAEAINLLSKIDKKKYYIPDQTSENEYLIGKSDAISECRSKIVDIKVSWNVNSFLKSKLNRLETKYWYQMQGYMELYDINESEVVFLLLNTPKELVEKEKERLITRFMIGEIDRDRYDLDMGNIETAYAYDSIPLKNRHFRFKIKREPSVIPLLYKRIDKARDWLVQFQKDMKKRNLLVSSSDYFELEKDNTKCNATKSLQSD